MLIQKIGIVLAGGVVLAGVVGGMYYINQNAPVPEDIAFVIEPMKDGSYGGVVPSLDREVVFGSTIPEEVRTRLEEKIDVTTTGLRRYPYDGNAWMDLALHYHSGNDFDAAEEVWLFLVDVTPTNVTALGNLGRLYHFERKQFEKAEEYFTKAIEVNPDRKEAYFELFDLYRYSYKKDTTAAVDIMKVGAERFPDDINFPAGLGVYYRDLGRPNQARVYFEKALSMAREIGDVNLIQNFTSELSRL